MTEKKRLVRCAACDQQTSRRELARALRSGGAKRAMT